MFDLLGALTFFVGDGSGCLLSFTFSNLHIGEADL